MFITFFFLMLLLMMTKLNLKTGILLSMFLIMKKNIEFNETNKLMAFLMFLVSSVWLIMSKQFLSIWLAMECQSFSLVLLMFLKNKLSMENVESMMKYFIISAFGGLIFLMGILNMLNTLGYSSLMNNIQNSSNIVFILMSTPFLLKLGVAPLHYWMPEIYKGLNWENMLFLSLVPKMTFFLILINMPNMSSIFFYLGILSVMVGSIGGMNQTNMKSLYGFSGIGHMGLMLMSFSFPSCYSNLSIFYFFIYISTSMAILILFIYLNKNYLMELSNLMSINNFLGVMLVVCVLSLSGFPPLSGFYIKLLVLQSSTNFSMNFNFILLILLFLMLSSFYYLSMMKFSFGNTKELMFLWDFLCDKANKNMFNKILSFMIFLSLFLILDPSLMHYLSINI